MTAVIGRGKGVRSPPAPCGRREADAFEIRLEAVECADEVGAVDVATRLADTEKDCAWGRPCQWGNSVVNFERAQSNENRPWMQGEIAREAEETASQAMRAKGRAREAFLRTFKK